MWKSRNKSKNKYKKKKDNNAVLVCHIFRNATSQPTQPNR